MRAFQKTAIAAILLLIATVASATNISFVPASSGLLSGSTATFGVITATSFYWNGSAWVQGGTLFGRNDGSGSEQGLGLCSPNEVTDTNSCYTVASGNTGGGEKNELSNESQPEIIRLTLATGYVWNSVSVSSLDNNSGGQLEHGMIWASNTATPSGDDASQVAGAFCKFASGGASVTTSGGCTVLSGGTGNSPTFSVPGGTAGLQNLFFSAYNFDNSSLTNNDYLIKAAVVSTPEPASMLLLGTGLVGLSAHVRRRFMK